MKTHSKIARTKRANNTQASSYVWLVGYLAWLGFSRGRIFFCILSYVPAARFTLPYRWSEQTQISSAFYFSVIIRKRLTPRKKDTSRTAGRRICVGRHIAMVLWAMNIEAAMDVQRSTWTVCVGWSRRVHTNLKA